MADEGAMMGKEIRKPMDRKSFDGYYYLVDEWGHCFAEDGTTTDPFEIGDGLYFSLLDLPEGEAWDGDDHIDFDYIVLEAHIAIHAAIDCDSGSFVEDFAYEVVDPRDAIETLDNIIDQAHDWFGQNWPEYYDKVDISGAEEMRERLSNSVMFKLEQMRGEE